MIRDPMRTELDRPISVLPRLLRCVTVVLCVCGSAALASIEEEGKAKVALGETALAPATVERVVTSITPSGILTDVTFLASDEFYGRFFRSPFAFKAAEWIRVQFETAGLAPGNPELRGVEARSTPATETSVDAGHITDGPATSGDGEADTPAAAAEPSPWFMPLADPEAAPNVIAVLPAREGSPVADRTIVISAHYDHLPPKRRGEDRIYNGADDNASGTCGIIAIARAVAALPERPACRMMFVAFTGEEAGLKGAKRFVAEPPLPLDSILGVFNLDMISRGEENLIYCDGRDFSEPLRKVLRAANEAVAMEIRFDTHPDWLDRSDQGPFLAKGVPAVLFSVEDHEDYHQVTDHADRILPGLAARTARLVALASLLLAEHAAAEATPVALEQATESLPRSTP